MEFLGMLRKNSCGISMGSGFWPYNFRRVLHNFLECLVVTVVILTHILQKYYLKQSRMQKFYVSLFYSPWIGNFKIVVTKYNLNCKKNSTEKIIISKKLTFIEIIKQIQVTWVVAVYTQWCFLVHSCCTKTFNCLMLKVLEYICRQSGLPVL